MGNVSSNSHKLEDSTNSFKHLNYQLDRLKQNLLEKEKCIKDLSSRNTELEQKLVKQEHEIKKQEHEIKKQEHEIKKQEHEIEQLNKRLLMKQNNNLTLIQKNLSLKTFNSYLISLFQKTDDEIADEIIACNSTAETHNDDWFYNILYERKNFIEAIKYFRSNIKPI